MRVLRPLIAPWAALALAASADAPTVTGDPDDTDGGDDTDTPEVSGCRSTPRPADAARTVVVSFPYDAEGAKADRWETFTLSPDGELARTGHAFTMDRAAWGEVVFTPDGSLGLVAQERGTRGVFTVDEEGVPSVVEAAWPGDPEDPFYASAVVVDDSGERAWVIDGNWPENGGGIYELTLDCETGAPSLVGRTVRTKLASGLHPLPGGRAVVVADAVGREDEGDVFLVDGWPDAPEVLGGAVLFPEGDALPAGQAVTADGRFVLVGDHSEYSEAPNRVAWAAVDGEEPVFGGAIDLLDPFAIAASPFHDAVLVGSGYGDALFGLAYAADAEPAFELDGEVTTVGTPVALPGSMAAVQRGALRGLVLVTENLLVRRLRFDGEGGVDDLGPFDLGEDLDDIPGALGVQP